MTISPKVAAIITAYKPYQPIDKLYKNIKNQVDEVIIVDNGENTSIEGCHWLNNPENGIAKAQNMGIKKARELECTHILLLDDDSIPAENMVSKLLKALKKEEKAAVIAPYIEEPNLNRPPKYIQPKSDYNFQRVSFDEHTDILRNLYYVAASGSLIPLEIFDHIGEMKEAFFIYFVDTEFCLRARAAGFDIVAVRDAKMQHQFGTPSNHSFFGKQVSTTNHPAEARKWMFKNRRQLWTKYFDTDAGYVFFDVLRAQSEVIRVLLFERHKLKKLQAMAQGLLSK